SFSSGQARPAEALLLRFQDRVAPAHAVPRSDDIAFGQCGDALFGMAVDRWLRLPRANRSVRKRSTRFLICCSEHFCWSAGRAGRISIGGWHVACLSRRVVDSVWFICCIVLAIRPSLQL